jgi:hypothetical protein
VRIPRLILTLVSILEFSLCASATDSNRAASLSRLPVAVQASVSAVLGNDAAEYHAHPANGGYEVRGARQSLAGRFESTGVELRMGTARWGIAFRGYGYRDALTSASAIKPQATKNRVEYRRGPLTEWYLNGPLGLEQGFTISEPPPKSNETGTLNIALTLSGNVTAVLEGNSLTLRNRDGSNELRYTGLAAKDADGKRLGAKLELRGEQLLLKVDDAGARYPLVIDPWIQLAELHAQGKVANQFGESLAVSGNTLVVGASAKVFVFAKPKGGWKDEAPFATLIASDEKPRDYFGLGVAIDGNAVVVGAPGQNQSQGAAYVFTRPLGGWGRATVTETAKLTASDGAPGDQFGGWGAVAILGNRAVVGAPGAQSLRGAAYVFVKPIGGWKTMTETKKLTASDGAPGNWFGVSVSLSSNTCAIGAYAAAAGKVYVFVGSGGQAKQVAELTASDGAAGDLLGISVSASNDAVVAGAPNNNKNTGAAYIFVKPASGWTNMTQTGKLTASDGFPAMVMEAVSISANMVIAGAATLGIGAGAAYLFVEPTQGWTDMTETVKLTASDGHINEFFGGSVAINTGTLFVGAPRHYSSGFKGAAYVFAQQ